MYGMRASVVSIQSDSRYFADTSLPLNLKAHQHCCGHYREPIPWDSSFSAVWAYIMLFAIFLTTLISPMQLAWPEYQSIFEIVDIVITGLFTVNIIVTFRTSVPVHDTDYTSSITDDRQIAVLYLRKWFWLDLVATIPWSMMLFQADDKSSFITLLRCIRVFRVEKFASHHEDSDFPFFNQTASRLLRMLLYAFTVAHWLGCLWWYLSTNEGFALDETSFKAAIRLSRAPFLHQYGACIHWGVWSLTSVGSELRPESGWQTVFATVTIVLGLFVFATILGNISVMLTQLDSRAQRFQDEMSAITEFFQFRRIPRDVQKHVLRYVRQYWKSNGGYDEHKLLRALPREMKAYIMRLIHLDHLLQCEHFSECSVTFLHAVCLLVRPDVCLAGDLIVRQGDVGSHVYIITRGVAQIVDLETMDVKGKLNKGDMFGEVALFSLGVRTVSVRAKTFVHVLRIDCDQFVDVLIYFPDELEKFKSLASRRLGQFQASNQLQQVIKEDGKVSAEEPEEQINIIPATDPSPLKQGMKKKLGKKLFNEADVLRAFGEKTSILQEVLKCPDFTSWIGHSTPLRCALLTVC